MSVLATTRPTNTAEARANAGTYRDALRQVGLEDLNAGSLIDLSALEFMDSSAIAMLLRVVANTGPVTVRHPSRTVRQVVQATGLQDVLRVES